MAKQRMEKPEQNRPIRETTYETLKHAIILGEISAGTRLIETAYAQSMHISRTPLREAFRKLELDGLVEYVARRGVVVSAFTLEDIEEIYTIRNALMMLIVPSIIKNITREDMEKLAKILEKMDVAQEAHDAQALAILNREFHGTIEQASDKRRILRVIESQEEFVMRFSRMAIDSIVRRSNAHQEHHEMLRLLRSRDEAAFSELTRKHINESMNTCLAVVSKTGKGKAPASE
ncbi:MAG: GntR family transcriptional regulator [Eubacteriales bacterium]|nr:GntR family transcriptional regulator [Eubacteriales bacterium]